MRTATVKRNKWGCREEWFGCEYSCGRAAIVYNPRNGETLQFYTRSKSGNTALTGHPISELEKCRADAIRFVELMEAEPWPPKADAVTL